MNQIYITARKHTNTKENKQRLRNEILTFTRHAEIRAQQRGIPKNVAESVYQYGVRQHHKGGHVYTLNKKSLCRLENTLSKRQFQEAAKYSGCYIVVSRDYEIITVGYRKMRFKDNIAGHPKKRRSR